VNLLFIQQRGNMSLGNYAAVKELYAKQHKIIQVDNCITLSQEIRNQISQSNKQIEQDSHIIKMDITSEYAYTNNDVELEAYPTHIIIQRGTIDETNIALLKLINLNGNLYYTSAGDNSFNRGILYPFVGIYSAEGRAIHITKPKIPTAVGLVKDFMEPDDVVAKLAEKLIKAFGSEVVFKWLQNNGTYEKNSDGYNPEELKRTIISILKTYKNNNWHPLAGLARFDNLDKMLLSIAHGTGWYAEGEQTLPKEFSQWVLNTYPNEILQKKNLIKQHNEDIKQNIKKISCIDQRFKKRGEPSDIFKELEQTYRDPNDIE